MNTHAADVRSRTVTSPRILFTSPCGPFPKTRICNDTIDPFYYRNTLGQRMFMLRSYQSWHPLHFLAQNLPVPSTVLEHPTWNAFTAEFMKRDYHIVAVSFTVTMTGRVLEMVRWVRSENPQSVIILGGYGTAVFRDPDDDARELAALVDEICMGEGLSFMRKHLADRWGIEVQTGDSGARQDLIPARHSLARTRLALFQQITVVGALGCPYGCAFCATSSQFNRQRIELASGTELAHCLEQQRRRHPSIDTAIIYDEDFLLDRRRFLEFVATLESLPALKEHPLLLTIFASVRSIQRYTIDELLAAGIGTIYIGVESLSAEVLQEGSMQKRDGDIESLFEELHRNGINTLGSLIIGWDAQTPSVTEQDRRRFVRMNPTFYQIVPLHPVPGTPLWTALKNSGRLESGYRFANDHVGRFTFQLASMTHTEAQAAVRLTYRELVREGGPWPFRLSENLVRGIGTLSARMDEQHAERIACYHRMLRRVLPLAAASRLCFWGAGFRRRWSGTMRASLRLAPVETVMAIAAAPFVLAAVVGVWGFAAVRYWISVAGDQPEMGRVEYGIKC